MFKTNKYYHDNIKNIIKNLVSKNASVLYINLFIYFVTSLLFNSLTYDKCIFYQSMLMLGAELSNFNVSINNS